jgi:hypothetical protein
MSKKAFNPKDWASPSPNKTANAAAKPLVCTNPKTDIETITARIEAAGIDIAPNYADWRDLGFAFADALGESGRGYFHRLSRFHSGYAENETDKQFDNCLKAHGHGVTIKTMYHLAKSAGVEVATPKEKNNIKRSEATFFPKSSNPQSGDIGESEDMEISLPTFPAEIYNRLPNLLAKIVAKADSPEDADLLLLGSLTVFSSCLPNIYGVYGQHEVFPNLFLFVSAKASAGKGRLSLCRRLVEPIHQMLRQQCKAEQEAYKLQMTEYSGSDKSTTERPQEPPLRTLIIPANNSATGLFQLLKENDEKGLIFETEGDTLAQTFKSEHGNYSDGFRKAFHHETISYNRRKDREFVELSHPQLSALLSGTPKQVLSLIPNAENGLFSRFMFYFMNLRPVWKDVFAGNDEEPLEHQFDRFGQDFFELNTFLRQQSQRFRFAFSHQQQQTFNAYFEQTQLRYLELCGDDYVGSVRRLGLIAFRIAMIFTALRILDGGDISPVLICSAADFETVLTMVKVLIIHAAHIFEQLPTDDTTATHTNSKRQLLEAC